MNWNNAASRIFKRIHFNRNKNWIFFLFWFLLIQISWEWNQFISFDTGTATATDQINWPTLHTMCICMSVNEFCCFSTPYANILCTIDVSYVLCGVLYGRQQQPKQQQQHNIHLGSWCEKALRANARPLNMYWCCQCASLCIHLALSFSQFDVCLFFFSNCGVLWMLDARIYTKEVCYMLRLIYGENHWERVEKRANSKIINKQHNKLNGFSMQSIICTFTISM